MGVFDRSNEAPGRTDYNARKSQIFAMYHCWKNLENPQHFYQKLQFLKKLPFLFVFPDFLSNGTI